MTVRDVGMYIEDDQLAEFGTQTARNLKIQGTCSGSGIRRDLMAALRSIREVHTQTEKRYGTKNPIPEAAQWLLDNWYLAQREGLSAAYDLKHVRHLRKDSNGSVFLLSAVRPFVRAGNGEVTKNRCTTYWQGFQKIHCLNRKELSLLIAAIKSALILELSTLCSQLTNHVTSKDLGPQMGAIFSSLRLLSTLDLSDMLQEIDKTQQILNEDPSGVYPAMAEDTQDYYRLEISKLALKYNMQEFEVAEKVLSLSKDAPDHTKQHIGYFLFTAPLGKPQKPRTGRLYISIQILLPMILTLLFFFYTRSMAASLLLLLPLWELCKNIIDYMILRFVSPRHVPKLKLSDGVPDAGKTICVISALLTDTESAQQSVRLLEEYYLSNRDAGKNLKFGILADLPESQTRKLPEAETWIAAATAAIQALNAKYQHDFYFFYRDRVFRAKDNRFMGWERKRGAILELARFLNQKENSLYCLGGNPAQLENTRYILTLDSDTRLCPGTARELIGAMLHPLNTPVMDTHTRIVQRGSAILQPRMAIDLLSAGKSEFSRIFAGQGGTDPYGCEASEVYMDLFQSGSFSGKGILDASVFLECMENRVPENTMLSHDLIEGAILGGYFIGNVELTDGFPACILSYYQRMHRWTRGDWQNLPWLFQRGKGLSAINKWKIFDNLRRSLTIPFTFFALFAAFLLPAYALSYAALVGAVSIASRLCITLAETALRRDEDGKIRYHSTIYHGALGGFLQTAIRLIMLPYEAFVSLHAILTALWRMGISHRNMLSWTTAAQSEKRMGRGFLRYLAAMWPCVLLGAVCIAFSVLIIGKAAGILWVAAPVYAYMLSLPKQRAQSVTEDTKAYLMQCAADIWHFFDTLVGEEDHYLPPDNWQAEPPVGIAHRTSPTNIGLCFLSAIAAMDLNIATKENALSRIEKLLTTIEQLPKWNGHLYNWYQTKTLEILPPAYVSTVDSGNLAGALIVLREALLEHGEEKLADRVQHLFEAMDFSPLYDSSRQLFYIGYDADKQQMTDGYYDLLASEARLSGYVAIAKGDVPRRHWRKLSRALVSKDGYRGMASWTGTMFEYLMPDLIMPCYRDSLLYESASFCVYVQKKRTRPDIPWGISESAFYALDPALNYQYKAHGCGALALKRGMDQELVISPYSTFLALPIAGASAVKNLKSMEAMGMRGAYGFWEALDMTPSRVPDGSYKIVRCVMAHHIGMSLISIANYLCDNSMQKRFLRDPAMAGHVGLLQEKVPIGGITLHRRTEDIPEKPQRSHGTMWKNAGETISFLQPECCLLSNGTYHLMITESGISRSSSGDITLYRSPEHPAAQDRGTGIYLAYGDRTLSLLPEPSITDAEHFRWAFHTNYARISYEDDTLKADTTFSVSPTNTGELRRITVAANNTLSEDAHLLFYFEPILARLSDYRNHPAFYKLGIQAYLLEDGSLMLYRIARGTLPAAYLCLSSSHPMSITTSREAFPGRNDPSHFMAMDASHIKDTAWTSDPFCAARVTLSLSGQKSQEVLFALCLGDSEEAAYHGAQSMLSMQPHDAACFPAASASLLQMNDGMVSNAMSLVPYLAFSNQMRPFAHALGQSASTGRDAIWQFGISGDFPMLCAHLPKEETHAYIKQCVQYHEFLSACGISFDLVFLTDDGGDYHRPESTAIREVLRTLGREGALGTRCGIHAVDRSKNIDGLLGSASLVLQDGALRPETARSTSPLVPPNIPDIPCKKSVQYHYNPDNSFTFSLSHTLPPRAWGNMLTSGSFGYFATDCGTGHMWYKNARECKVNRWLNDPLATRGTETLELHTGHARYSLFASPGDDVCRITYDFGTATWEKKIEDVTIQTTAFVPLGTQARVFIITAHGMTEDMELIWQTDLLLAADDKDAVQVVTSYHEGVFSAVNARSPFPDRPFHAVSSLAPIAFTCDKNAFLTGRYDGAYGAGYDPCIAAVFPHTQELILVCGYESVETLKDLAHRTAHERLQSTKKRWRTLLLQLEVETPEESLNHMINGWAAYQTVACRILGRSSIYQSGGAYGFRDQLQDFCGVASLMPEALYRHILECCARQFEEGDVQHWWHPSSGIPKGVRTRCSDDLLWLTWALCEYTERTGDVAICDEMVYYLKSPPLKPEENDRYETPEISSICENVLMHCMRAMQCIKARGTGVHGLLLIGTGDWNDGMDRVGEKGAGESVWLTWFYSAVAQRFSKLLQQIGETEQAQVYSSLSEVMGTAANHAWDGDWYLRGYFDSGAPLGSHKNQNCKIDSIAQSFSVYCTQSDPQRRKQALENAVAHLFDRENNIISLFTPPFENTEETPGYIESYGPGFRENGGQYTHAAVWLAIACLREGMTQEGYDILYALLPEHRDMTVYGAEPFVLAADIYTAQGSKGRAGWSWYTGSSSWYYRAVVEELLGIQMQNGRLFISPHLPAHWPGYRAVWGRDSVCPLEIVVDGDHITVNGAPYDPEQGIAITLSPHPEA